MVLIDAFLFRIMEGDEWKRMEMKYSQMMQLLKKSVSRLLLKRDSTCMCWTFSLSSFRFDEEIYAQWTASVDEKSKYNLSQPLITRNEESKLIQLNFNPQVGLHNLYLITNWLFRKWLCKKSPTMSWDLQLVSVLREVKYLDVADTDTIPKEASKIFAAKESFRQYVANVDLTQQWYNKVS